MLILLLAVPEQIQNLAKLLFAKVEVLPSVVFAPRARSAFVKGKSARIVDFFGKLFRITVYI
jgi:hypothetical protein